MLERINWIKELQVIVAPDEVPSSKWQGHSPFKAEMLGSSPAGITMASSSNGKDASLSSWKCRVQVPQELLWL